MKYYNYFTGKLLKAFTDIKEINCNKIEFTNGLSFYYDFFAFSEKVSNTNYREEIQNVITELHRLRAQKIDPGYFMLLCKLREKLVGVFKEIELVEFDKRDVLVFITEEDERFMKEFEKGIINTYLFYETMSEFVIEEIRDIGLGRKEGISTNKTEQVSY